MIGSWYDQKVLPYFLDWVCGSKAIRRQRQKIIPSAGGVVLEIGIGTGLNMRYYDRSKVTKIIGLDPALQMHGLARKRILDAGLDVQLINLSAEKIPLDDRSMDTVVVTYSLCSIPDPVAALSEMRRVLVPNGQLLFCEHGRAPDQSVRRWQERLTPTWMPIAGGCHLNRDVPTLLAEGGFICPDIRAAYVPGPRPFSYTYWGTAKSRRRIGLTRIVTVNEQTFYRWKKRYGRMSSSEVRQLRELRQENVRLKLLVADLSLDKHILRDVLSKKL